MWYIGMFGSMALAGVGLYYKPDTRCAGPFFRGRHTSSMIAHKRHFSINTWAMKEAKQRMEARGDPTDYRPS